MKIYLVGGAVRDQLLKRPCTDNDFVVVGGSPDELEKLGYISVGGSFPVFLHPTTKEEYALARKEKKVGPGYKGFAFDASAQVTLDDDLLRRDFTVNAMALDGQKLIDPFHGKTDLDKKILRHVSKHFSEDPLRILRAARFAAQLNFTVAPETVELIKQMIAQGMIEELTPERVRMELEKAFLAEKPSIFFKLLDEWGALKIIFPELEKLKGVPQPEKYHPEGDAYIHTLLVIDAVCELKGDLKTKVACLCHDYGKALTDPQKWPSHIGHEALGVDPAKRFCERLKFSNEVTEFSIVFTREHIRMHQSLVMKASTLVDFMQDLLIYRRREWFDDFLKCATADQWGKLDRTKYKCEDHLRAVFKTLIDYKVCVMPDSNVSPQDQVRNARIAQLQTVLKS